MPTTDTRVAARDHHAQGHSLLMLGLGLESPDARTTDPSTSHEAADSADRNGAKFVVRLLLDGKPMADHEMVAEFERFLGSWPIKYTPQRLRTARHELTDSHVIEFTGIYRLTPSGRRAQVWGLA